MASSTRNPFRTILSVTIIGASVLGLMNVMGDNAEVVLLAGSVACQGQPNCQPERRSEERNPLKQKFLFQTPQGTVDVSCARAYLLLGSWQCTKP